MSKLALLGLLSAGSMLVCAEPKIAPTFHLRLDTPLTSYASPRGTEFTGTVISRLEIGGQVIIPQGSLIRGTVRRASAVGFGLIHERATLELAFDEYELADGQRYPLGAHLQFIENAREEVDSRGRIRGVLAASSAQGLVRGIWYRPTEDFFHRSALGLTGLSGELWSRFSLGPVGAAGMLAARYIVFRLPEPEIRLPQGTEMRLLATSVPKDAPSTAVPDEPAVEDSLAEWLRNLPASVTKPDGTPTDTMNVAFIGSGDDLLSAFAAAGWVSAERLTLRTFSTEYKAYFSMSGYPKAPVSKMLYQGAAPAAVFQKSLNTITKRHHIRVWSAGVFEGEEVWLGAATHDAGVRFRPSSLSFTHKIDPQTDRERSKVIADIRFTGCAANISSVDRPNEAKLPSRNGSVTDGDLAVIWLKPCAGPADGADLLAPPPGSKAKRLTRRFVLETRQYFLRDNMYYWAYRAVLWGHRNAFRSPVEE